ncbi:hypothetical protein RBH26_13465 [Natronolimnohabitans sp. A-GB9]|uniref:DUF7344 domain-containing protein n=1 Tax=Natronolimnohabitans sp. A-GB9 TaxID=3069757 RepID=UPI0027B80EF0|nr:hypothetical protein [Natronolimnohabitans sp. A-GB9]MDQ2051487.1 hypothetical protein [Natronolimnohabitans sp. A-GB9]
MRLTPFWLCSTSADSTGDSPDDTESGVTIYHTETSDFSSDGAAEFVPESNSELVAILDEMETPATVDEVADQLINPARPPVETWATVHERLHQHRLPELDATGHIEFDEEQGLVERRTVRSDAASRHSSSRSASRGLLIFLIAVSVSALALAFLVFTLFV